MSLEDIPPLVANRGTPLDYAGFSSGPEGIRNFKLNFPEALPLPARPIAASTVTTTDTGALRLTKELPAGWTQPEGVDGTPIFVTWGAAGGIIGDVDAFREPIGYVTAAGTRYVWAKIGLSSTVSMLATSLEIVSSTSSTAYSTGAFDTAGNPPAYMYVYLGYIYAYASGGSVAVNVYNTGSGSIVPAVSVVENLSTSGMVTGTRKQLVYWRTDV